MVEHHLDRILIAVLLHFLLCAILGGVAHAVALVAVGLHLQQGRAIAFAGAVCGLLHGLIHVFHLHAVHGLAGHLVGVAKLVKVFHVAGAFNAGAHRIIVVLDDEDDGQFPCHRHVQGFVEGTLPHGTIAHVAEGHMLLSTVLVCESDARSQRNLPAHDAVASEEVVLLAEHVHRASFALHAARDLAEQFCHHLPGRHAKGDGMHVVTVGGNHLVALLHGLHTARHHGLLTDVEVTEAAYLLLDVKVARPFLELAPEEHVTVPLQIGLLPEFLRCHG